MHFSVQREFYPAANTVVVIKLMDGNQLITIPQQIIASQQQLRRQRAKRVLIRNQSAATTVLAMKQAPTATLVPAWTTGPEMTAPSLTPVNQVHVKMMVSAQM